jgi:hypothetical protein
VDPVKDSETGSGFRKSNIGMATGKELLLRVEDLQQGIFLIKQGKKCPTMNFLPLLVIKELCLYWYPDAQHRF